MYSCMSWLVDCSGFFGTVDISVLSYVFSILIITIASLVLVSTYFKKN